MTDSLDIVSSRINHKRSVVVCMIMLPYPRLAIILPTSCYRRTVECIDSCSI